MNNNTQNIKELLHKLLKAYGIDDRVKKIEVLNYFKQRVGQQIAKHITDIYIHNDKLIVCVDSAVVRNELLMVKTDLIKRVNEYAKTELITDIILK